VEGLVEDCEDLGGDVRYFQYHGRWNAVAGQVAVTAQDYKANQAGGVTLNINR